MAHQLTGKTIASTYEQLIYRTTTVPSTGTTTTQLMTSEADQTDDIGLPLYIGTENVGIGTATPRAELHVESSDPQVRISDSDASNTTQATAYIEMYQANNTAILGSVGYLSTGNLNLSIYNAIAGEIVFSTSATQRMTIDANGKVGIGTGAPEGTLEISNKGDAAHAHLILSAYHDDNTYYPKLTFRKADDTEADPNLVHDNDVLGLLTFEGSDNNDDDVYVVGAEIVARVNGDPTDSQMPCDLEFWTNSGGGPAALSMMIEKSGDIGIGHSDPDALLHVEGVSAIYTRVESTALANGAATGFSAYGTSASTSTTHLSQIGLYNHAGITDATSFIRLDAQDDIVHYLWATDGDDFHSSPTIDHIGTVSGTKMADMTSDERLKDISSDAFPYGLDTVNSLTPIQYKWKVKKDKSNRLGFGAQTTQGILPETVKDTKECIDGYKETRSERGESIFEAKGKGEVSGNTKLAMEYQQIIPVLVKAVQELSAKVTALENA